MSDKPFKAFEREVAALIGGKRFPANSGAEIDVEGPTMIAQCKLRGRLSLEEITQLAETTAGLGLKLGKVGIVAVKVRRGAGHPSPGLVVMTFEQFNTLIRGPKEWQEWKDTHTKIQERGWATIPGGDPTLPKSKA